MANLKQETIEKVGNKKVLWVGSSDGKYAISYEKFLEISDFEYDDGYGAQRIYEDLVLVFDDGSWLSREEYDGSEWWGYYSVPVKQTDAKEFNKIKLGMWNSLSTED